jgi:hypothetical protein
MTDKDEGGIVVFSEDKPLIHYGLIRGTWVLTQQYTQIKDGDKLLITVILKDTRTGKKKHRTFTLPKRKDYWERISFIFHLNRVITNLRRPANQKILNYFEKDFRMSSWEDILDFFQTSDDFDLWIEQVE